MDQIFKFDVTTINRKTHYIGTYFINNNHTYLHYHIE